LLPRGTRSSARHALTEACVANATEFGALAQLGERLLCKQDVIGSIPIGSTILSLAASVTSALRASLKCKIQDEKKSNTP
jgi:hypothetical protein